jgi:hypothetical protein
LSSDQEKAIGAALAVAQFLALAADTTGRLGRAGAILAAAPLPGFLALLLFTHLDAAQTGVGATVPMALALGVETLAGSSDLIGVRAVENMTEQTGGERGHHLAAGTATQAASQGIEALGVHHALLWTVRGRKRRCFGIGGWRCRPSYPIRATKAASLRCRSGCRQAPAYLASTSTGTLQGHDSQAPLTAH